MAVATVASWLRGAVGSGLGTWVGCVAALVPVGRGFVVRLVRGCAACHVGCAGLPASGRVTVGARLRGCFGASRRASLLRFADAARRAAPHRPHRRAGRITRVVGRVIGRVLIRRDGDRAGRGDKEGLSLGSGPLVVAGRGAVVAPSSEGLRPVVSSAQGGEGVGPGLARWTVLLVGSDVIDVTSSGVPGAKGEDAVPIAQDDQLPHPRLRVVRVDGVGAGHVEDGLDGDPGPAGPVLDAGDGGRSEPLDGPEPGPVTGGPVAVFEPEQVGQARWR